MTENENDSGRKDEATDCCFFCAFCMCMGVLMEPIHTDTWPLVINLSKLASLSVALLAELVLSTFKSKKAFQNE